MMTYVTIAQHFSVVALLLYPHVNKCTVSLMITIPYPHLATLVFLLTILTSHLIILITALHCYDVIRQQALYLGMGYKLVSPGTNKQSYSTLHYTTLHYTTLHYTTLHISNNKRHSQSFRTIDTFVHNITPIHLSLSPCLTI